MCVCHISKLKTKSTDKTNYKIIFDMFNILNVVHEKQPIESLSTYCSAWNQYPHHQQTLSFHNPFIFNSRHRMPKMYVKIALSAAIRRSNHKIKFYI